MKIFWIYCITLVITGVLAQSHFPVPSSTPVNACTNGKVYKQCGTACPLTCANKDQLIMCPQMCVSGCFCPGGMVLLNDNCIQPTECPADTSTSTPLPTPSVSCKSGNTTYGIGETFTATDGCNTCTCTSTGVAMCTLMACPPATPPTNTFNAPYIEPPLSCPNTSSSLVCVIESACTGSGSNKCDSGKLCCSTGCGGMTCTVGIEPSPLCSAVKLKAQNVSSGLLGAYVPECDNQGRFSQIQCHEGYCWCVNILTGKATSQPARGQPNCTASVSCESGGKKYGVGETFTATDGCNTCTCTSTGVAMCTLMACPPATPPTNTFNAPYIEPPLSCPNITARGACIIESACTGSGSNECDSGKLCCSTGCGMICTVGIEPSPLCSAVKLKAQNVSSGLLGAYVPECDNQGRFSQIQCHEGYCWCVNILTGKATSQPARHEPNCTTDSDTGATPTPTCTNGKIYEQCGTACPLTCANKDNPPSVCPAICKSGCFCPSGMVQHNGGCVNPQDCPVSPSPQVCTNGKVHSVCGTACPLTCANKDNPPGCIDECVDGCFCPTGMVISGDTCVQPENCPPPPPACTNGKVHSVCGTACPLTCANKDNPPGCIDECVDGCFCPTGMVISGDTCVQPENCPPPPPVTSPTPEVTVSSSIPDYCSLSPEVGSCRGSISSYFYNSTSSLCESFIYGGCGGNKNRFTTKIACLEACAGLELPSVSASLSAMAFCPKSDSSQVEGTCDELCTADESCGNNEKCCSNGCGHSCVTSYSAPYYKPPKKCPAINPLMGIFCSIDFGCKSHNVCKDDELCCPTGCGSTCMKAVIPSPLCSVIKNTTQTGLIGAYTPQCDASGNFSNIQCHGSIGMCWCADTLTGKPLSSPVMHQQPVCDDTTSVTLNCDGIECEWPNCGANVHPISDDKHCCPYCPSPSGASCTVDGVTHANGTTFTASDGCNTCHCLNGVAGCTRMACASCTMGGETHASGTSFTAPDGCNTCHCINGVAACTEMACAPCVVDGVTHASGTTYTAPDGCNTCHCTNGVAACTEMACAPCVVDGVTHASGTTYTAPDGCNTCHCTNGVAACTEMACASCTMGGETHPSGTSFTAPDGCNTCNCHNGVAACTKKLCPPCVVDGVTHASGTSFKSPDGCNTCFCSNGVAGCTEMACASCSVGGKTYFSGTNFTSADGCNTCFCSNGIVVCTERACLPVCSAGGMTIPEGQSVNDSCSVCSCSKLKITCVPTGSCHSPISRTINVTMKFNGDFDKLTQNSKSFKLKVKWHLITTYGLGESQITAIHFSRGSVIITVIMKDDNDITQSANVTRLLVQMEQDYKNQSLVIVYQNTTLTPVGNFTYTQTGDDNVVDDDYTEEGNALFWIYISISGLLLVLITVLTLSVIVAYRKRHHHFRHHRLPITDNYDYAMTLKTDGGTPNALFTVQMEKI